jgi:hypothetical protein
VCHGLKSNQWFRIGLPAAVDRIRLSLIDRRQVVAVFGYATPFGGSLREEE